MTKITWYTVRCSGCTFTVNCRNREEVRHAVEEMQREFPSSIVYVDTEETFVD